MESGFSVYSFNGTMSVLIPGDVFGLNPKDVHGYFNVRNTKIYNCLFYKEVLANYIDDLVKLPGVGDILNNNNEKRQIKVHLNLLQRKEISLMTGFDDANYFSRIFKKNTALTPAQYREAFNLI